MVEATGVEPVSERSVICLSPSAVHVLKFPRRHAHEQAYLFGSFMNTPLAQSFARLRFLLYDTSYPRRRHPGLMSGYIKLLMQNYLLRLSLMHTLLAR